MKTVARFADSSVRILVVSIFLIVAGCVKKGEIREELALKNAFKDVMTFDPSDAVTGVRAAYLRVQDTSKKWLFFECDDATIAQVRTVAGDRRPQDAGFTFLNGSDGPEQDGRKGPGSPAWWKHPMGSSALEQITVGSQSSRGSVVLDIWIDSRNHAIYARKIEMN